MSREGMLGGGAATAAATLLLVYPAIVEDNTVVPAYLHYRLPPDTLDSMKILASILILSCLLALPSYAVETAPRISDRYIIEALSRLEAGQAATQQQIQLTNKRIDDLQGLMDKRIDDLQGSMDKRINDLQNSINKRFDTLEWIFGLFITISTTVLIALLGTMGRLLWIQHREMGHIKTSIETQKDELTFLKTLIEKMLPPRGVL